MADLEEVVEEEEEEEGAEALEATDPLDQLHPRMSLSAKLWVHMFLIMDKEELQIK